MITIQTVLKITDNSGALQAMCINLPVDNTPAKDWGNNNSCC